MDVCHTKVKDTTKILIRTYKKSKDIHH